MIKNEIIDCILARRSTRNFKEEQIEEEQLETLLEAASWAPSGGNNQSWLFTAIQNKEILLKINELVREGFGRWTPDDDYPESLVQKLVPKGKTLIFIIMHLHSSLRLTSLIMKMQWQIVPLPLRMSF